MARVRISSSKRLLAFILRPLLRPVPMKRWLWLRLALAFVLFAVSTPTRAQTRFASGQHVVPAFAGWGRNPDGSFNMVFGYMNRNYEEEIDLPVGPDNMIEPGLADQGQPLTSTCDASSSSSKSVCRRTGERRTWSGRSA